MDSFILKGFNNFLNRLSRIIGQSFSYKVFKRVSLWLARLVKGSFIFKSVCEQSEDEGRVWKESRTRKIIEGAGNAIRPVLGKMRNATVKALKSSHIAVGIYRFYSGIMHMPISVFGIIGMSAAVSYPVLSYFANGISGFNMAVSAALGAVSLILLFGKVSLINLIRDSRIAKWTGLNGLLKKTDGMEKPAAVIKYHLIPVLMGSAISAMVVFLPLKYAAAGSAALFLLPAVLIKPVVGVMLLVPATAFIPTMAAVGLVAFIWFAAILNLVAGRVESQNSLFKGRAAALFMIVVLSGGVLSFTPALSIASAAVYMVFVSTVFLFMILLKNRDQLKVALAFFVCAAALASLYGIYQYVTGNIEAGWVDSEMFEGMKRIYSTFENPNVFGEYLLISIPFSMALFFGSGKAVWKVLWLGAGGLMFIALLLTMSRGCWIGLAAGVFIYFAIADRRYLWIFPVAVIALPFVLPQNVLERLLSIGNLEDSSSLYRLYIWLGTISMLKDYWPTGVGLGTKAFSGIYSAYAYNGVPAPHAHNLYLQILSETGVAGLLSFAWVSIKAFRNSVSTSFGKEKFKKHIGAGFAAALTGFFVQGIFDNVFYNYRIYLVFFITVAMTYTYSSVFKKRSYRQIEKD